MIEYKLEIIAWIADVFVLISAYLTAQKAFPATYYVSIVSAILFGIYAWVNNQLPLVVLDIMLFCLYSWGIIKHRNINNG